MPVLSARPTLLFLMPMEIEPEDSAKTGERREQRPDEDRWASLRTLRVHPDEMYQAA